MVGKDMNYIIFGCIIVLLAYMDSLAFHRPHDTGFWSLTTRGSRIDAWHVSKWLVLAMITYVFVGIEIPGVIAFLVISVVLHGVTLHGIFK